ELFFFPSYSPQLNPDEYLNNMLKKNIHSGDLPHTEKQLEKRPKIL
ncbi:MAG: transposase, partial [Selenomonadaceae bacterium]|nr:transposase [Selenomonadaceae bacterium]